MAEKILTYSGLQAFYNLIDEKYIDTSELNTNKGLLWAHVDPDDDSSAMKVEVKLGDGLKFDLSGAITTVSDMGPATDSKLGMIKTWINTYNQDENPTGDNVGIKMIASDPVNAPTVLDRATIVGVEAKINRGKANGYAPLNENGIIPIEYMPSAIDDVKEGYYDIANNKFYSNRTVDNSDPDNAIITYNPNDEIEAMTERIYYDLDTGKSYRYGGTTYIEISSGTFQPITIAEIEAIFE